MESNGRQQRRSAKPAVAQEGTEDSTGNRQTRGGEADSKKPNRGVHKKVMLHGIPHIRTDSSYPGKVVRAYLAVYRKKYYQAVREKNRVKKRINKTKEKKKQVIAAIDKRFKITYLKLYWAKALYKKMKAKYIKLLREEKGKTKKFIQEQKKEIRKQALNKIKNYYYNPNYKSNPGNHQIIAWVRIFSKLTIVCRRTKLKWNEVSVILWISSQKEGEATAALWAKTTGFKAQTIKNWCRRLVEYNLVNYYMLKGKYHFELTDRGKKFIEPIIEYVKKEHAHAKRFQRKIIRDRVQTTATTSGIQDGGEPVQ